MLQLLPFLIAAVLSALFAFAAGIAVGERRTRPERPAPAPPAAPAVVDGHGLRRVPVRFTFRNSVSVQKRLFEHSIASELTWRGRAFAFAHANADGELVYREVVS